MNDNRSTCTTATIFHPSPVHIMHHHKDSPHARRHRRPQKQLGAAVLLVYRRPSDVGEQRADEEEEHHDERVHRHVDFFGRDHEHFFHHRCEEKCEGEAVEELCANEQLERNVQVHDEEPQSTAEQAEYDGWDVAAEKLDEFRRERKYEH